MLSEKFKKIHALHNLGVKKKKGKNRFCFEAHSKAVTFHTITSLWVVFSPVSYTHLTLPTKRIV